MLNYTPDIIFTKAHQSRNLSTNGNIKVTNDIFFVVLLKFSDFSKTQSNSENVLLKPSTRKQILYYWPKEKIYFYIKALTKLRINVVQKKLSLIW